MTVAVIDESKPIQDSIKSYLELEGLDVRNYFTLKEAELSLQTNGIDLLILEVNMPDGDGFSFTKRLKKTSDIPLIFLTSRNEESDRITGFELGADDYIAKPFSLKELSLRVKAVLKRNLIIEKEQIIKSSYSYDASILTIYQEAHKIYEDNNEIILTQSEWKILSFLIKRSPQVFSRDQILNYCLCSIAENSKRTVDSHIKNIRHKFNNKKWISTIRGFGYRFEGK